VNAFRRKGERSARDELGVEAKIGVNLFEHLDDVELQLFGNIVTTKLLLLLLLLLLLFRLSA